LITETRELGGLTALVLGGTGLIGSHVVQSLLCRGCSVRVVTRVPGTKPALHGLPVQIVAGSLESPESIRSSLEGCDLLFHVAAPYPTRHFGMGETIKKAVRGMEELLRICREMTPPELLKLGRTRARQAAIEQAEMAALVVRNQPERFKELAGSVRDPSLLLDATRGRLNASQHLPLAETLRSPGLKRVIYTSSITTIGQPQGQELGSASSHLACERDRYSLLPDPSPYFACKRQMESAVARSANEGLPVTIVNPSLVIDEGDSHLTTGRLILPIARGKMPFYIPGYVNAIAGRDVGEGHVLAAIRGRTGQRYILSHAAMELRELAGLIAMEAGVREPRIPIPLRVAEPISLLTELAAWAVASAWAVFPTHGLRMLRYTRAYDNSLAVGELGLPQTSIRDSIGRALAWYRRERLL